MEMITDLLIKRIAAKITQQSPKKAVQYASYIFSKARIKELSWLTLGEAKELDYFLHTCGDLPKGFWLRWYRKICDDRMSLIVDVIDILFESGFIKYNTESYYHGYEKANDWIQKKGIFNKGMGFMNIPELKRVYRSAKMSADYKAYKAAEYSTSLLLKELCISTENQTN